MKPKNDIHAFRRIQRAGVPLVFWETPDPARSIIECCRALNGAGAEVPILVWDIVSGMRAAQGSQVGADWLASLSEDTKQALRATTFPDTLISNPPVILGNDGQRKPGVVFAHNMHAFLGDVATCQAVWNSRDAFKSQGVILVMMGPAVKLPAELSRDVVVITEALPDAGELGEVLNSLCKDAGLTPPDGKERVRTTDTLLGLSTFEAEQVLALSLSKEGIDQGGLWDRKVKAIEQTPGLTVYKGREKYADVGGLANAKNLIGRTISGKAAISCLVFLDELDKGMSASSSDSSGTTQDQLKALLSYMQDEDILGGLFLGPPGTGKTVLAKASAGEYGIPLIMLDLGALKGSLVGQSEQNMRQALRVIHAVSDGRALFLGACNRTDGIPPELRRRFSYTSLFFDLPDREELDSIWAVWRKSYKLTKAQCDTVRDDGWTGAEIRNACLKAWSMDCPLSEAAQSIVPISRSAADIVQALRQSAAGKYISASKAGLFTLTQTPAAPTIGRRIES